MNNTAKLIQAASFAAKRHTGQTRKGDDAAPYINHPLEVANLLAAVGKVEDYDILIAAILHDTVEDTIKKDDGETKADLEKEITELFGTAVCNYVLEVTDDKELSKQERKQKQIEHAPHISDGAKQVKLADKISNITDVMHNPPAGWSLERKLEYIEWGAKVVAGLRGANADLEKYFDELVAKARTKFQEVS